MTKASLPWRSPDCPALRLDRQIMTSHAVARTVLAKTSDAAIDDPVVDRPQSMVAEPKSLHDPGPELFNQHVGLLEKRR